MKFYFCLFILLKIVSNNEYKPAFVWLHKVNRLEKLNLFANGTLISIFDRFTDNAVRVVMLGQEESRRSNGSCVGTEHLLLGLLAENSGCAAVTLKKCCNITLDNIRDKISQLPIRNDPTPPPGGELPFSPRAKLALQKADELSMNVLQDESTIEKNESTIEKNESTIEKNESTIEENESTIEKNESTNEKNESTIEKNESTIDTEHILLGIISDEKCSGFEILKNFNINIDNIKKYIYNIKNNDNNNKKKIDRLYNISDYVINLNNIQCNIIGREDIIQDIFKNFTRKLRTNVLLIGEDGIGKSTICHGVSKYINNKNCPLELYNFLIIKLDLSLLLYGSRYRGEFENRIIKIIDIMNNDTELLLVVDDIHLLFNYGVSDGQSDISTILKPALTHGFLRLLGTTTPGEYKKYFSKDPAMLKRFQPIQVNESSDDECVEIVHSLKEQFENFHKIRYTDSAIRDSVTISKKYIPDRFNPSLSLDILDETATKLKNCLSGKILSKEQNLELNWQKDKLERLTGIKNTIFNQTMASDHVTNRTLTYSAFFETDEALIDGKHRYSEKVKTTLGGRLPMIDNKHVLDTIMSRTGIPKCFMSMAENEGNFGLKERFKSRIVGQDDAIDAIDRAIKRARVGVRNEKRPIASFLFCGPTGVGKTQIAKILAEYMFESESNLVRLDMSEFQDSFQSSKLIGAPPGYVGFDDGGQLTEKIKKNNFCVILFDEIEKAHFDIYNYLLSILDDGILTDSKGKTVSFKNTVIILTTNLGGEKIRRFQDGGGDGGIGFNLPISNDEKKNRLTDLVMLELKSRFRPEFINRVDDIIIFNSLKKDNIKNICDIMLKDIYNNMNKKKYDLILTYKFKELLYKIGYNNEYGARPMRRAIARLLEDRIADEIIKNNIKKGDQIIADVTNDDQPIILTREKALQLKNEFFTKNQ
eukprot:GHVL01007750.1.p1 GENE.GHVL01007750.1~~GHVL01007750.1.p1  ORF type:complete len:933 (+),score=274.43 GHVL01007750.1:126-2924(+)